MRRAAVAILLLAFPAAAQAPTAEQSVSYVASVKPNNAADARTVSEYFPGGRFTAVAVTAGQLLRIAYRVQAYQVVGGPSWIWTRRFDIEAKADTNPAPPQQTLLRALLKDRFNLAVHNDRREMPVFALVLARKDGRLGPQLVQSTFDCAAYRAAPHGLPEPGRTPNCATRAGAGALSGKAISLTQLATTLGALVSRFTVDRTGLAGVYDVELTWTSDVAAMDASAPSLFTALQEQLGLKLVAERGPVDVLVVDRLEEPTKN